MISKILNILIFIIVMCPKGYCVTSIFFFTSRVQLETKSEFFKKDHTHNDEDKKLIKRHQDIALIALDLDNHKLTISYLNKNQRDEYTLNPQIQGTGESFSYDILKNENVIAFHYDHTSSAKILSIEYKNNDQMIFAEVDETTMENFLVLYMTKTDWIFRSETRTELPSAVAMDSFDKAKTKKESVVDTKSIISIDKENKDLIVKDKSGKYPDIKLKYKTVSYGEAGGINAIVYTEISDPEVTKIIFSITTSSLLIIYKNKGSVAFDLDVL